MGIRGVVVLFFLQNGRFCSRKARLGKIWPRKRRICDELAMVVQGPDYLFALDIYRASWDENKRNVSCKGRLQRQCIVI